jgi:hypothetical protein
MRVAAAQSGELRSQCIGNLAGMRPEPPSRQLGHMVGVLQSQGLRHMGVVARAQHSSKMPTKPLGNHIGLL